MTVAIRHAVLAVALLLGAARSEAQLQFFTPPPNEARLPDSVARLLKLHVDLRLPDWKPEVSFAIRDRDFELPSSVRKACVAGQPIRVEIQLYRSNQGAPDVYRGESIGCYPQGGGMLIRSNDNNPGKPVTRYWIGNVRNPAEVPRYEPEGKSNQVFDRMVSKVVMPIEQGLGLDVFDGGKTIRIARIAENNPPARIDHYKRGEWFAAISITKVDAGTVYVTPDFVATGLHFSDAALAREAVSDVMWRAASWLPPAQRESAAVGGRPQLCRPLPGGFAVRYRRFLFPRWHGGARQHWHRSRQVQPHGVTGTAADEPGAGQQALGVRIDLGRAADGAAGPYARSFGTRAARHLRPLRPAEKG